MKTNKFSLIAVIALGGLVAFGPLASAQDKKEDGKPGSRPEGRPGGRGGQGGDFVKERLARMTEELKLTDEQKPKVEAVLKAQGEKMRGLRDATPEERREKMKAGMEEMSKKMKEILTAEQFEKWEKQMKERSQGRGERRGPPGEGGDKKPEKSDDKK